MPDRRKIQDERGQTMVEFALVVPILLVLLVAIVEVGISFNHYLTLTDATRAGARKAAVSRFTGDRGAAAKAAVISAASGLDPATLEPRVSVTSTDWTQGGSDVSVTASYPYSIDVLGVVVKSGSITSTTTERLE